MGKRLSVGEELTGAPRLMTEQKMVAFERVIWHRVANVHSDQDVAKKVGMSKIIASGQMQLAYLHEMMETHFGDGWARGGKIAARWVCPVYVGDTITPHARIAELAVDGGRTRAKLDIWCTNQAGTQTALGTAEAYL